DARLGRARARRRRRIARSRTTRGGSPGRARSRTNVARPSERELCLDRDAHVPPHDLLLQVAILSEPEVDVARDVVAESVRPARVERQAILLSLELRRLCVSIPRLDRLTGTERIRAGQTPRDAALDR